MQIKFISFCLPKVDAAFISLILKTGSMNTYIRSISSVLLLLVFCTYSFSQDECTTILVGRKATADGSVIIAHAEDMGKTDSGKLWHQDAGEHEKSDSIYLPYETIPGVSRTYSYWAHGNSDKVAERYNGSILAGMNQFGVSFGCNTVYTRDELIPEGEKGLQRYSIRRLIMERARTALEAVEMIGQLIDTYGQSGIVVAYLIADPREAWVVETTPRHWVAKRVPDDGFHVQANRYTIEKEWDLASHGLVEYAVKKEWYDPSKGEFSFRHVYADPERLEHPYDTVREYRAWEILKRKSGSVTVADLKSIMRSHYEGTEDYHYPPHNTDVRRPICVSNTQAAKVWHLRSDLPVETGAVMWYATSTPCVSIFVPVFSGAGTVPLEYLNAGEQFDLSSVWWTFDALQRTVDSNYDGLFPYVEIFRNTREGHLTKVAGEMQKKATAKYLEGKTKEAKDLMSDFSFNLLRMTHIEASGLLRELLRKSEIEDPVELYR